MAIENFPVLSRSASSSGFTDQVAIDPTIRSEMEGGYAQTRARFTRLHRKYTATYDGIKRSEMNSVQAFEETVGVGSNAFYWTHPTKGIKVVRLYEPIQYTPWESTDWMCWKITLTVEEV